VQNTYNVFYFYWEKKERWQMADGIRQMPDGTRQMANGTRQMAQPLA